MTKTPTPANPSWGTVLASRLSRRGLLRSSLGVAGVACWAGWSVWLCHRRRRGTRHGGPCGQPQLCRRGQNVADRVSVPAGYSVQVLYALGDPLTAGTPAFKNDGTDTHFEHRAGDHHDGMEWFGLSADGKPRAAPTCVPCWP